MKQLKRREFCQRDEAGGAIGIDCQDLASPPEDLQPWANPLWPLSFPKVKFFYM